METNISSYAKDNDKIGILHGILISMRPKQWTKNLLLFAGIIFSQNLLDLSQLLSVIIGFLVFSLVSGSVYLLNDISDLEQDKKHPRKCRRPLAAGDITIRQAFIAVVILLIVSVATAFSIRLYFGITTVVYFIVVGLYSFYFKHIVIMDVLTIAAGFVLRAIAGVVIIKATISPWLILCTVLLALFLALSKRRHEMFVLQGEAGAHRKVLNEYSIPYLDQMISIVTAATIVAYSLYTFYSRKGVFLMATIPFVIYGIFRYLYLVHQQNRGGSPEAILLEDRPLLIDIILWGLSSIILLYFT